MNDNGLALTVFVVSLFATFTVAIIGRRTSDSRHEGDLAGRSLNRWLIGLSAGATANSGFILYGGTSNPLRLYQ